MTPDKSLADRLKEASLKGKPGAPLPQPPLAARVAEKNLTDGLPGGPVPKPEAAPKVVAPVEANPPAVEVAAPERETVVLQPGEEVRKVGGALGRELERGLGEDDLLAGFAETPEQRDTGGITPTSSAGPRNSEPVTARSVDQGTVETMKMLLTSTDYNARLTAIKLARQLATPDMADLVTLAVNIPINSDSRRQSVKDEIARIVPEILDRLITENPKAVINRLVEIYSQPVEVNEGGRTSQMTDHQDVIKTLMRNASPANKPKFLAFAIKALDENEPDGAIFIVTILKIPEGVWVLQKIEPTDLVSDGNRARNYMTAIEAIGTKECIPLLTNLADRPELHSKVAAFLVTVTGISI
ncbi:Uncharacterised protein [Candidatus Bilamarchaeum dharawalense]|uniref:Uncharacterized protein n=1 Tax=Candidatus Bilamarchaeum dharawalense TaxID=2885759 RepID=A0A5E4LSI1_9ARCH|nr:Uncharacterised protein [Candidatus Bilamarchaeum dharawalense]